LDIRGVVASRFHVAFLNAADARLAAHTPEPKKQNRNDHYCRVPELRIYLAGQQVAPMSVKNIGRNKWRVIAKAKGQKTASGAQRCVDRIIIVSAIGRGNTVILDMGLFPLPGR
jgi:hypothetical protein